MAFCFQIYVHQTCPYFDMSMTKAILVAYTIIVIDLFVYTNRMQSSLA